MQLATNFPKELTYPLSAIEIEERSKLLASVTKEIESVELEKSKANRGFGERLKTLKQRQLDLANAVEDQAEKRPVLCSERADMRRFQVETYRLDTTAIVDTRAMTPDEVEEARQGGLFVEQPSGGPGVRVAPSGGGLDLSTPPPASDGAEPAPGATITNPEGLLNGEEAKKGKGRRKKKGGLQAGAPPEDAAGEPDTDVDEDDLEPEG